MIACPFHQPAFRRHLDDGEQLPPRAKAHLSACPKCREMLAAHHAIIGQLSARRNEPRETPSFLHARIMNNLETTPHQHAPATLRWLALGASLAAIAVTACLLIPNRPAQQTATWSELPTKIVFKTSIPENPLEQEIQNLRADTLNAAKALTATFLPESESPK
jgi:hypothetical protein